MPVSKAGKPTALPPVLPALVDEIIRSKRRTIAIIVHGDGRVIVRAPLRAPERTIRDFVESKAAWIKEKKAQAAQKPALPVKQFVEGEKFLLLGREVLLQVVQSQRAALSLQENRLCIAAKALPAAAGLLEKWYRAHAATVMNTRVQYFSGLHGFRWQKIRISSARTRWGSCSSRGVLSFTWRLVMAPQEVIDYVVIHELAHLKIKNHSAVFWAEVARLMPDYKRRVDWLKKNGHTLTLNGE